MRLVMMGTGTFAEPTFEALLSAFGRDVVGLVTQPERDGGRKGGSTRQTGKGMANIAQDWASRERQRPEEFAIAQPASINTPEGLEQLRAMKPDLLVVAAYGQILSKDVLAIPTRGAINVHASLLPKYRGAAPVAYAILNGETQTGVTIIKITPGLDSGDMILQESLDILPDDTTGSLEARLATLGAKLAVEVMQKYKAGGPIEGRKQDPALVTKAPKIKKEFGLIDWTKPAEFIERFVRAMQPWPTAYTFLHRPGKESMRIILGRTHSFDLIKCDPESHPPGTLFTFEKGLGQAEVDDLSGHLPIPTGYEPEGTLFTFNKRTGEVEVHGLSDRLLVTTGYEPEEGRNGVIQVSELQPAGKKKMSAEEFLRGYPIVDGTRFGPEVLS